MESRTNWRSSCGRYRFCCCNRRHATRRGARCVWITEAQADLGGQVAARSRVAAANPAPVRAIRVESVHAVPRVRDVQAPVGRRSQIAQEGPLGLRDAPFRSVATSGIEGASVDLLPPEIAARLELDTDESFVSQHENTTRNGRNGPEARARVSNESAEELLTIHLIQC